jgi:hypothetical protein
MIINADYTLPIFPEWNIFVIFYYTRTSTTSWNNNFVSCRAATWLPRTRTTSDTKGSPLPLYPRISDLLPRGPSLGIIEDSWQSLQVVENVVPRFLALLARARGCTMVERACDISLETSCKSLLHIIAPRLLLDAESNPAASRRVRAASCEW